MLKAGSEFFSFQTIDARETDISGFARQFLPSAAFFWPTRTRMTCSHERNSCGSTPMEGFFDMTRRYADFNKDNRLTPREFRSSAGVRVLRFDF